MDTTNTTTSAAVESRRGNDLQPGQDLLDYAKEYARQKPEVMALWCLGIGFIVGWKLKPW